MQIIVLYIFSLPQWLYLQIISNQSYLFITVCNEEILSRFVAHHHHHLPLHLLCFCWRTSMLFRQNRLLGSQRQIVCFQYLLYNFLHNILTDIFFFAVAERPAVGVTSSKRNHGRISEVSKARGVYGGGSLVRPTGKKNRAMSSMTKSASLAVLQVTAAILVHLFFHWQCIPLLYVQTGFVAKIQNL